MSYFTVRQAAYLMGLRVDTVREMMKNGKILYDKLNTDEGDDTPLINETEMSRFQHPWEHIFRLDERINAQQILVEQLKAKINDSLGTAYRSDVEMMRIELERMKGLFLSRVGILTELPAIVEDVHGYHSRIEKVEEWIKAHTRKFKLFGSKKKKVQVTK